MASVTLPGVIVRQVMMRFTSALRSPTKRPTLSHSSESLLGANSFKNDKEYTHDEPIAIHLDDQEKEDADKIEEMRKQTFSCNRIALDYYVSELSMAVIAFISYLTPSGTNFWLIKSNHVEQTMNSYIRVKPTLFPKVNHILKNLKQIAARDLSKGPDDTLKNKTGYTVNRLYSYFILPEDKVTTQTEELEYIEEVLKQTGECIQQISTNNVYMSALETTTKNTGKGTFYKVMMNPNSGMNYTEYIKSTSVQIQRVKRFNLMAQESKIKYLIWRRITARKISHRTCKTRYGKNFLHP